MLSIGLGIAVAIKCLSFFEEIGHGFGVCGGSL
jgi:hypothetical protein